MTPTWRDTPCIMGLMPASRVSTPLTDTLPWLVRWDKSGRQFIGLACLFPDCNKVVPRHPPTKLDDGTDASGADNRGMRKNDTKKTGAPMWFCSETHADEAERRRQQLLETIIDIQHRLDATPLHTRGVNRRELESDLAFLGRALAAYPLVRDVRPEAADRRAH